MKKSEVFSCEKCGEMFEQAELAEKHEGKCPPLEVGQRVKFLFGLIPCEGRITGLHPPERLGSKSRVDLETDIEVDDVDALHDGKHVWVERKQIYEVLSS